MSPTRGGVRARSLAHPLQRFGERLIAHLLRRQADGRRGSLPYPHPGCDGKFYGPTSASDSGTVFVLK